MGLKCIALSEYMYIDSEKTSKKTISGSDRDGEFSQDWYRLNFLCSRGTSDCLNCLSPLWLTYKAGVMFQCLAADIYLCDCCHCVWVGVRQRRVCKYSTYQIFLSKICFNLKRRRTAIIRTLATPVSAFQAISTCGSRPTRDTLW